MTTLATIVAAAQARIAEMCPDLKTNIELSLSPSEAKYLKQLLDFTLIPSLMEAIEDAAEEGHNIEPMLHYLDCICGVSNRTAEKGKRVVLELDPFAAIALRQALHDVLIPWMDASLPSPEASSYEGVMAVVRAIKRIYARLELLVDDMIRRMRDARDEIRVMRDD